MVLEEVEDEQPQEEVEAGLNVNALPFITPPPGFGL